MSGNVFLERKRMREREKERRERVRAEASAEQERLVQDARRQREEARLAEAAERERLRLLEAAAVQTKEAACGSSRKESTRCSRVLRKNAMRVEAARRKDERRENVTAVERH